MINYEFINAVLAKYEGKAYARGYVPCKGGVYFGGADSPKGDALGASGVTIATGVDLGQQTLRGLAAMGVYSDTLGILHPYLGLQKQAAINKLKEAPLTISPKQVEEIDEAVHKFYIQDAARKFGQERFDAAPKEVQAVAVSLCYQFGTPYRAASPGLGLAWEALRAGNYKDAALHLANPTGWSAKDPNHQQYLPRRRQEASLLAEVRGA